MSFFYVIWSKLVDLAPERLRDSLVQKCPVLIRRMLLGYRMILDLRVHEQESAHNSGHYEDPCIRKCLEVIPPGGVCLDIGANIGFYTCAVANKLGELRQGGEVYAFEPSRNNYQRLNQNIGLNGLARYVKTYRLALGAQAGVLELYREPTGSTNNAVGRNMMSKDDLQNVQHDHWPNEKVKVVKLDDWAKEVKLERCDLIKIDIEGAEMLAFEGGRNLIAKFRPVIIGEFSPYWMKQIGQSFEDVIKFFDQFDYSYFREVNGEFLPVTPDRIARDMEVPNYLLMPN